MIKIAIVGSGPSAFYAAQAFFKADDTIYVDMFEKLPTPFGLLRGGVAPDHQRMKTVSKSYEKIASHSNFRFFGNVEIGVTIDLDTLRSHYHSVIFAIGAETDRKMGIPGEDLPESHTATEFVAWYNGQPDYQSHAFDLQGSSAIIIGQGNVAVDVARILA
jgi:ferredoxin--NADP+ reductase